MSLVQYKILLKFSFLIFKIIFVNVLNNVTRNEFLLRNLIRLCLFQVKFMLSHIHTLCMHMKRLALQTQNNKYCVYHKVCGLLLIVRSYHKSTSKYIRQYKRIYYTSIQATFSFMINIRQNEPVQYVLLWISLSLIYRCFHYFT